MAVAFDSESGLFLGEAQTVIRNVSMESFFGGLEVAVSANGTIAYVPGGDRAIGKIVEIDRLGETRELDAAPGLYGELDLDPSNRFLALHVGEGEDHVRI